MKNIGVILESLNALREMAEQDRADMLVYLIGLAVAEAEDIAAKRNSRKPRAYHS